jgi:hypothetical protein
MTATGSCAFTQNASGTLRRPERGKCRMLLNALIRQSLLEPTRPVGSVIRLTEAGKHAVLALDRRATRRIEEQLQLLPGFSQGSVNATAKAQRDL